MSFGFTLRAPNSPALVHVLETFSFFPYTFYYFLLYLLKVSRSRLNWSFQQSNLFCVTCQKKSPSWFWGECSILSALVRSFVTAILNIKFSHHSFNNRKDSLLHNARFRSVTDTYLYTYLFAERSFISVLIFTNLYF